MDGFNIRDVGKNPSGNPSVNWSCPLRIRRTGQLVFQEKGIVVAVQLC